MSRRFGFGFSDCFNHRTRFRRRFLFGHIDADIDPGFSSCRSRLRRFGSGGVGGRSHGCCLFGFRKQSGVLLSRRNDHGLFELILLGCAGLLIGETKLMVTNRDDITMLQSVFLDQLAVDVGAVGAVQILEKRIVQNIDDQGMVATDSGIIDAHIVVRKASNRVTLFGHVVLSQNLAVQTQD